MQYKYARIIFAHFHLLARGDIFWSYDARKYTNRYRGRDIDAQKFYKKFCGDGV